MIPQTDRRCKPFLGKKRPGREKAHGVSSRPGVRTARPVQTPSGKLSAVVWAAGAGFMQGGGFVGSPAGAPPAAAGGRSPPEPAQRAPCGAWDAGALWWGRMVRGGRPPGGWCGGNAWARAGRVRGVRVGAPQGPARRAGRGRAKPGRRRRRRRTAGPPGLGRKENGYSWSCSPTSRSRTIPPVAGRFLVRRRWSLGTMPGT